MPTARKLLVVSLREGVSRPGASSPRVDREKGIIYGVKILGEYSTNGRRYTPEAMKKAVAAKVYEGKPCNVDHPKKAEDLRAAADRLGKYVNVREGDDGLYADIHYLKSHPMAERLCEAAERMPDILAFSHNADASGWRDDQGILIVEEINDVRSVDLVSEGGTTHSLFEGRQPMKTVKKKATLEGALKKFKGDARLKGLWRKVLEMDGIPDDATMAAPDELADAEPEDTLKAGFRDAIMGLVDQALDGDAEAGKKIVDFIKQHQKINPGKAAEEADETGDDKKDKEKDDDMEGADCYGGKKMESKGDLAHEVATLKREKRVRELCEDAGVKADRAFVADLMEAGSDKAVKRMIDQARQLQAGKGKTGPRSQGYGPVTEGKEEVPSDPKDLGKWVME